MGAHEAGDLDPGDYRHDGREQLEALLQQRARERAGEEEALEDEECSEPDGQ